MVTIKTETSRGWGPGWGVNPIALDPQALGVPQPQPSPFTHTMPRLKGAKSPVQQHTRVPLRPLQVGLHGVTCEGMHLFLAHSSP